MPPVGRVPGDAHEVLTAWCVTPFWPIQASYTLHYCVGNPLLELTNLRLDSHKPYHAPLVPDTRLDEGVELHTLFELVLVCKVGIVLLDL